MELDQPNKRSTKISNTSNIINDYNLNIGKALTKKLKATQRARTLQYRYTSGGIVITADAVTFKLFKMAAMAYYEGIKKEGVEVYIQPYQDKSGATVQYTAKIKKPKNPQYTVNIYTTQSKLLVNGKGSDILTRVDAPKIQEIVVNEADRINLDVDLLNNQLQDQLKQLTDCSKRENISNNIICPKCTRPCRTKGTFCKTGNHWVHHSCQKLSAIEIEQVEGSDDTDTDYTCKLCDTPLKQVRGKESIEESLAETLLMEEVEIRKEQLQVDWQQQAQQCPKCEKSIERIGSDVCSTCNRQCHMQCMEYINEEPQCYICTAASRQDNQIDVELSPTQTVNMTMQQPAISQKEDTTTAHKDAKYSELRAKEIKLKKMEDQVKLREKAAQEANNNRTKLESRCQELEARNHELEHTVKTLVRRIESLEVQQVANGQVNEKQHHSPGETSNQNSRHDNNSNDMAEYFNQRFKRLHRKLTDVVFDSIDKHIDNMQLDETIHRKEDKPNISVSHKTEEAKTISANYSPRTTTNEDPTKLHGIPLIYSHPNKKAATEVCQQKSDNTQKIWNGAKKAHVQHPGPSAPLPPRQHYYVRRLESQIPPTHHPVNQQPLYNMATGAACGNNPFLVLSNPQRNNINQF